MPALCPQETGDLRFSIPQALHHSVRGGAAPGLTPKGSCWSVAISCLLGEVAGRGETVLQSWP